MNRIAKAFEHVHSQKAVIPFLVAGDPTFEQSIHLFETLLEAGADILEIGIPYSDPLADGPVIQSASSRSLANGFCLKDAFSLTERLRARTDKALVLFTYINPVLQYKPNRFFHDAVRAGADGVIIPDLPLEEAKTIRQAADEAGIALIPLVAPTSDPGRIEAICGVARGFVYCVSALGVTGVRTNLSEDAMGLVSQVRCYTNLPIAVGFGIGTPEQAHTVANFADGVIVGSAYIRRVSQGTDDPGDFQQAVNSIRDFTIQLVEAVKGSSTQSQSAR